MTITIKESDKWKQIDHSKLTINFVQFCSVNILLFSNNRIIYSLELLPSLEVNASI